MTVQTQTAPAISVTLDRITFGSESTFENLSVVPMLDAAEVAPRYLTLDEALAGGWATVGEFDQARVSEIKVVVSGNMSVLLLDGEELVGAKQNRVVNLTILIPPNRPTVVPVSCVESGRWRHVSRGFGAAPRAQFAEGRAAKMRQVTASLRDRGCRASDQAAVWHSISEKSARFAAMSDTCAMSALYDKVATGLEEFVSAFAPIERQVGAVFFINGSPAGLELFDAASTWRKLGPKLVRSYAVDALDRRRPRSKKRTADAPDAFVKDVATSAASIFPAIGEGSDVRLTGTAVTGAALVAAGRVVHLSAFPIGDHV